MSKLIFIVIQIKKKHFKHSKPYIKYGLITHNLGLIEKIY